MNILITGATGFIGSRLCEALAAAGDAPIALSRRPADAQQRVPALANAFAWSPMEEPPPQEALEGVDAVVHLAGENVSGRWTAEKKRAIRESRVQGTRHLVEALQQSESKPGVLVSASAVGIYGDRGDEELTEDAEPGSDFLADVCAAWEAEAQRAASNDVRVVNPRIGIVLGPNGGALQAMLTPFKLGAGGPLGSGQQWWPWVHREDVVGLIRHAIEHDDLQGPVNATAPSPARQRDFAKALGRVLGRPALMPAPAFALKLLLGEFSQELLGSQRVLPERAQAAGYTFQYPDLEPALQAILESEA
ncbi:MAG: TIGR01777 family oxidoreductase [Candidatus Bipolaricaulia bacterium]